MRGPSAELFEGLLQLPPEGLESAAVLAWIQRAANEATAAIGEPAAWLIACGDEVVGCISLKGAPVSGVVEIGYGVAASRRGRGHASAAVACVIEALSQAGFDVRAETMATNRASERVLERNGFSRCGERLDEVEEVLTLWRRTRA
jgi:RimJ/RimL family protein N-acetyltransferase